ncbi:hypothetical protein [Wenxinia marina]|uniref:Uncharacterized protein n=1 Tax=Wenxinia marina DSM 24838 TaxID=1123501 RepID=A0A0D0QB84_9RHOB|nr:hypothetical protein [Wenxinia marina]KIQ69547.1 hypothetical protein Wenmar_01910 [Wenxinia marina DSM 24838]GGL59239.1 hypothetical protein GCM10011392_12170 [Wenxinia marina]
MRTAWMIALAGLAGGAGGGAQAQTLPACEGYPGDAPSYACTCTGSESGSVWGSGPYTSTATCARRRVMPA